MEPITECKRCGLRKLLVIPEVNQSDQGLPVRFDVWAGRKPFLRAGRFQITICCHCGNTEWTALDLGEILERIAELHPDVRLVDGELADAVTTLGLVVDRQGESEGWKFLAEGVHQDVALRVGQRIHQRTTDHGFRSVLRVEVQATARADLGNFSIRHSLAVGFDPKVIYRQPVRTGDPSFDLAFSVVQTGPEHPGLAALAARGEVPVLRIPWLDSGARARLKLALPEEVFVFGSGIVMLLPEYNPSCFPSAIELALQLARWNGAAEHPYR